MEFLSSDPIPFGLLMRRWIGTDSTREPLQGAPRFMVALRSRRGRRRLHCAVMRLC